MSAKDKDEEVEKGAMDNKEKEESSKEKVNPDKTEDGKSKDDQDVVFVQDVGFTVKIIAPNLEPFDIQVPVFCYFDYSILICRKMITDN